MKERSRRDGARSADRRFCGLRLFAHPTDQPRTSRAEVRATPPANQTVRGWRWPAIAVAVAFVSGLKAAPPAQAAPQHWEIAGKMSEACTCQIPCGCNFRSGPSPHHYCWSLASFDIEKGRYGQVDLAGLRLVRAHGGASVVWYMDDRATARQEQALRAIATRISGNWGRLSLHFERAQITQSFGNGEFRIGIGDQGGFDAAEIIGGDGKNPIVVENMTAWNVQHDIKGRTKWLRYKDQYGNQFDLTDTNANLGTFDWTDKTQYF